jgi:hypothetical protein
MYSAKRLSATHHNRGLCAIKRSREIARATTSTSLGRWLLLSYCPCISSSLLCLKPSGQVCWCRPSPSPAVRTGQERPSEPSSCPVWPAVRPGSRSEAQALREGFPRPELLTTDLSTPGHLRTWQHVLSRASNTQRATLGNGEVFISREFRCPSGSRCSGICPAGDWTVEGLRALVQ